MSKQTKGNRVDSSFAMQVDARLESLGLDGFSVRQVGLLNKVHAAKTCEEKVKWMADFIADFRKSVLNPQD